MCMKKILYILLSSVVIFNCVACNDDFDPKIYGILTKENFPQSESDFESLMMTCYLPFINAFTYTLYATDYNQHPWYIPSGGALRHFDATSDLEAPWVSGVWTQNYRMLSEANFSLAVYYPRNMLDDETPSHYPKTREVTRFTEIIASILNAPANAISTEKREEFLGEARMCRGLQMYNLLHVYGPVPLLVDPSKINDLDALRNAERPTIDEITDWIYDDFQYAIDHIAEVQPNQGRFNKDFARVCLMRHCLNEGYHKDGYYQKALDLFNELNTGKYRLFTSGTNPYKEMFRECNDWNCEIIMSITCDATTSQGARTEGGVNPFVMLATPWNSAKKDDLGNPTPFAISGPGWGMTFNLSPKFYNTFEADDLRKEPIITRYYTVGGEWWGPADIGKKAEWDGYIPYKYPAETGTAPVFGNDFPVARWADVLLMFAEAEVRKTGAAPSTDAVNAVNEVRARAGLGPLQTKYTDTAEHFLDALLTERGHELWFEGMRKIDLIRFNQYAVRVKKCKGKLPTHQYMPIPNYAVQEAEAVGKHLEQTFSRPGWDDDVAAARNL